MKKKIFLLCLFLILSSILFAQTSDFDYIQTLNAEKTNEDIEINKSDNKNIFIEFPSALGFGFRQIALTTFMGGIIYQRWFDKIGFETMFGGYYSASKNFNYAISLEGMYSLYRAPKINSILTCLYLWCDLGHYGISSGDNCFKFNFNSGFGFGLNLVCFEHISMPLEFGYSAVFPNDFSLGFTFSTGIMYRF